MPSANGAGCGVGVRVARVGPNSRFGLLFQQFEVLKHGARQLVGIVEACICEVRYFGCDDFGGEVIWLPEAKRSAHPLVCRLHGPGDLWTEISGVHCYTWFTS
jgi:hypothetical protein